MQDSPLTAPLPTLAARLRDGTLSARALAEAAIARHDHHALRLNAYRTWAPELARELAERADAAFRRGRELGPLQGLPVSVKDLYGVSGLPTYAGTRLPLPPAWGRDGPLVAALRDQAAVITGKTHTGELALGGLGYNPHWGTPRNPWDGRRHRAPGGSSSGAAVSLWEGSALLALGTDTGGSVRVPASLCGCVGLKLTAGRWPLAGIVPLTTQFDTPGLLARDVADVAYGFCALDARDREPPAPAPLRELRIGVADPLLWADCAPGVAEALETALWELAARGARVSGPTLPQARAALDLVETSGIAASECHAFIETQLPGWRPLLGRHIVGVLDEGAKVGADELAARKERYRRLAAAGVDCFRRVDVIVSPTVRIAPPPLDELEDLDSYRRHNSAALGNTVVVNVLGLCALSLPVGLDRDGLPVGMQLIAPGGAEGTLLATALAVEQALGTARQRLGAPPPLTTFRRDLAEYEASMGNPYITSIERLGIQQGIQQGERALLARMLTKRFGPLPDWAGRRLEQADVQILEHWAERVLDADCLEDVFIDPVP